MNLVFDEWDDGTEESGKNRAWSHEPDDKKEFEEWEEPSDRDPDEDDWEASVANDLACWGED